MLLSSIPGKVGQEAAGNVDICALLNSSSNRTFDSLRRSYTLKFVGNAKCREVQQVVGNAQRHSCLGTPSLNAIMIVENFDFTKIQHHNFKFKLKSNACVNFSEGVSTFPVTYVRIAASTGQSGLLRSEGQRRFTPSAIVTQFLERDCYHTNALKGRSPS